jgi:hypothetical protein
MYDLKAPTNYPGAFKKAVDLFRSGIGSHIEVLGFDVK